LQVNAERVYRIVCSSFLSLKEIFDSFVPFEGSPISTSNLLKALLAVGKHWRCGGLLKVYTDGGISPSGMLSVTWPRFLEILRQSWELWAIFYTTDLGDILACLRRFFLVEAPLIQPQL